MTCERRLDSSEDEDVVLSDLLGFGWKEIKSVKVGGEVTKKQERLFDSYEIIDKVVLDLFNEIAMQQQQQ